MMTTTIQLNAQESLSSASVKLKAAGAERVLLVVPPELVLGRVDLRILRRLAVTKGVNLALVTSDPSLRSLACEEGISTFQEREHAEQARWRTLKCVRSLQRRPVGSVETVPPYGGDLYRKPTPNGFRPLSFLRASVRRSNPWWAVLPLVVALLLIFGGLLTALSTIIPSAHVAVVPSHEPIQVTVQLQAMQGVEADAEAGIVPVQAISAEVAGEARSATTGHRYEPDARSKGEVVLVNRTGRSVAVPVGTVVRTATGNNVRFTTMVETQIEPNGRATVPIEALTPGPGGDVRAGTVTQVEGPLALSLLATNEIATSGGSLTEVGVVTVEDQDRLQAELFQDLKVKAYEALAERLEPGSFLPSEAVSYIELSPTFTPFVGEVAPELFLSMSVRAVGLVVDTEAGQEVALERLQEAMPPGSRLVADSVRYIPGSVRIADDQTVSFSITAEGTLLRAVDEATVRASILGLTPEAANTVLAERFPLAVSPQVTLGPDWLPLIVPTHVPIVPWRIQVVIDWDAAASIAAR